jgi:hypothetical protein
MVKVKLFLCFSWAPRHEGVLGEWKYSSTHSLTSVLDGGEWTASRPRRFTSRERTPGIHWIGDCVGPRAVLDAVVERKIPSPRRESKPRTPIIQPLCTEFIRTRKRSSDWLRWTWHWSFGFHKRWGISWVAERILASQEGLRWMEWRLSSLYVAVFAFELNIRCKPVAGVVRWCAFLKLNFQRN